MTPAASPNVALPSPVSWHVAFWVLVTLAINSMTQPTARICGVSTRYRVYLCSSPFVCVGDALSMVIRLATTAIYLRVSPPKAACLVLLARSEHISEISESHSRSEPHEKAWPRWLFFIVGVLPSAIKLSSFSGTPRTQALGLMFVVSFITIELVTLLGRASGHEPAGSVPATLGLGSSDGQALQRLRLSSKVARLNASMQVLEISVLIVALFTHISIGGWTVHKLWISAKDSLKLTENIRLVIVTIAFFIVMVFLLLLVLWVVLIVTGSNFRRHLLSRMLKWLYLATLLFNLIPNKNNERDKGYARGIIMMCVWIYLFLVFWLCYRGMTWICKRWPAVGKALLIETRVKEVKQVQDPAEDPELREDHGTIEGRAWESLCFFITNLLGCLLWYAFMYDSTGTVNPCWTDVFG